MSDDAGRLEAHQRLGGRPTAEELEAELHGLRAAAHDAAEALLTAWHNGDCYERNRRGRFTCSCGLDTAKAILREIAHPTRKPT
mgnify:CR=1 FL=1